MIRDGLAHTGSESQPTVGSPKKRRMEFSTPYWG